MKGKRLGVKKKNTYPSRKGDQLKRLEEEGLEYVFEGCCWILRPKKRKGKRYERRKK